MEVCPRFTPLGPSSYASSTSDGDPRSPRSDRSSIDIPLNSPILPSVFGTISPRPQAFHIVHTSRPNSFSFPPSLMESPTVLTRLRDPVTDEELPENTIRRTLFSARSIHLYNIPQPGPQSASTGLLNANSYASSLSTGWPGAGPAGRVPSGGTRPAVPGRGPPALTPASLRGRPTPPSPASPFSPGGALSIASPANSFRAAGWTRNPNDHLFEGNLQVVEYMIPIDPDDEEMTESNGTVSANHQENIIYLTNTYILFQRPVTDDDNGGADKSLFAACQYVRNRLKQDETLPVTEVDTAAVEQASDSSRFFAIKVLTSPDGRKKRTVGLGFEDREPAFEFSVVLQDIARRVEDAGGVNVGISPAERMARAAGGVATPRSGAFVSSPNSQSAKGAPTDQDLSLRPGQQIRIPHKRGSGTRDRKPSDSDGSGSAKDSPSLSPLSSLLPPPPSSSSFSAGSNRRIRSSGAVPATAATGIPPLLPPPPPPASATPGSGQLSLPTNQTCFDSFLSPSPDFRAHGGDCLSDADDMPLMSSSKPGIDVPAEVQGDWSVKDGHSKTGRDHDGSGVWTEDKAGTGVLHSTDFGDDDTWDIRAPTGSEKSQPGAGASDGASLGFDDDADFGEFQ